MNPEYTDTGTTRDSAFDASIFLRILVKAMLHDDPCKESKMSRIVRVEFPLFSARADELHSDSDIRDAAKTMEPYKWWKDYGRDYPTLKPLAVRLLAQVCGAGDSERKWRDWDAVKTRQRGRLSSTTANKLVQVYCSKRLKDQNHNSTYQTQMREWAKMNETLGLTERYKMEHKRRFFLGFLKIREKRL